MRRDWQHWTIGEIDRVAVLASQGLVAREIAEQVGRSASSVRHLAHKESISLDGHKGPRAQRESFVARQRRLRAEIKASAAPEAHGSDLMDIASRILMNLTELRRVVDDLVTGGLRKHQRKEAALGWRKHAACRDVDPGIFYPERGNSARVPIGICLDCPVRVECLTEAVRNCENFGVWGGTVEINRRRIRALAEGLITENSEVAS